MYAFMVVMGVALAGCLSSNVTSCENGDVCPSGRACDVTHRLCVEPGQLTSCAGRADGADCTIDGSPAKCRDQVCLHEVCGDGVKSAGEACDGSVPVERTCKDFGFYNPGGLTCTTSCSLDTSGCSPERCGDQVVNGSELCDGAPPVVGTCVEFGFDAGALGCTAQCAAGLDDCRRIGWHAEGVDGPFLVMWSSGPSDVYAGSGDGIVQHYDGTRWTPSATGAGGQIFGLWGSGPGDVYAVTTNGDVAHLASGTWSLAGHVDDVLLAIGGSRTTGDVFALGYNELLHATAGGTFSPIATTLPPLAYGLWVDDTATVYLGNTDGLWRLDGTAWSIVVELDGGVTDVFGIADDLYVTTLAAVFHRHGATGAWTRMPIPGSGFERIVGTAPDDLYCTTNTASFHFDGTAWVELDTPANALGPALTEPARGTLVGGDREAWRYPGSGYVTSTSTTRPTLRAVAVVSPTEIHAVGDGGAAIGFDGSSWHDEAGITVADLTDVWQRYAVGKRGVIMKFDPASRTWQHMASPAGPTVTMFSIWGTGVSDLWAVGEGGTALHYNGTAWSAVTTGALLDFVAVGGTATNDVYVIGRGGDVLHTTNQGSTWTRTHVANVELHDVFGAQPGEVWLVGDGSTVLRGSGTTFSPVIPPGNERLVRIDGSAPDDIRIVIGNPDAAFDDQPTGRYLLWNGGSMSSPYQSCSLPSTKLAAIAGIAPLGLDDYAIVGPDLGVFRMHVMACTPEVAAIDTGTFAVVSPVATGRHTVFVIGYTGAQRLLLRFDGALTSHVATPSNTSPALLWGSGPTDLIFVDSDQRTVYRFDGAAWSQATVAPFDITAIGGSGPADVWLVGVHGSGHWDGTQWTFATTAAFELTAVWSAGPGGPVFATTRDQQGSTPSNVGGIIACWSGSAWAACSGSPDPTAPSMQAIWGSSATDAFAVGDNGDIEHWNGTAWSPMTSPTISQLVSVGGTGPTDVFASSGSGRLFRYDGRTWTPVHTSVLGILSGIVSSGGGPLWMALSAPPALVGLLRDPAW